MKRLLLLVLIVGCSVDVDVSENESQARRRDAAVDSPTPVDAPAPGAVGWASCYSSGAPSAACNLSTTFCCFDQINAPNNGWCTANGQQCLHSFEYCDGNEDCPSGQACWEHSEPAQFYEGFVYVVACTSTPPAGDKQLCHPGDGTCPSGTSCVLAEGPEAQLYGFSPTMYVCS